MNQIKMITDTKTLDELWKLLLQIKSEALELLAYLISRKIVELSYERKWEEL